MFQGEALLRSLLQSFVKELPWRPRMTKKNHFWQKSEEIQFLEKFFYSRSTTRNPSLVALGCLRPLMFFLYPGLPRYLGFHITIGFMDECSPKNIWNIIGDLTHPNDLWLRKKHVACVTWFRKVTGLGPLESDGLIHSADWQGFSSWMMIIPYVLGSITHRIINQQSFWGTKWKLTQHVSLTMQSNRFALPGAVKNQNPGSRWSCILNYKMV